MADIVTSRQFTDGERGITAQKLNDIVGSSTIQPAFYSSKPTAPTADPADIALILKAGAFAQVPISSLAGSATQAQIWDTRLRSFNATGNPNFEVNQYANDSGFPGQTKHIDRWNNAYSTGAGNWTGTRQTEKVLIPGTNYCITNTFHRVAVAGSSMGSVAAGDYMYLFQRMEGIQLRELISDVHSLSLLVRSSVAGLKFSVSLQDSPGVWTLAKLCTIPTADVWTLIALPNLPVWTASGSFPISPGSVGCFLNITLVAGSGYIIPSNDVWVNSSTLAAIGADNFLTKPVNSTFDIAFVQHEPGPLCTTLMDKPFTQNLDECLRYYCKSYDYGVKAGTGSVSGYQTFFSSQAATWSFLRGFAPFPRAMAINPTVAIYSYDGTPGAITGFATDASNFVWPVSSWETSTKGIANLILTSPLAQTTYGGGFHYTADTGL